MNVYEFVNQVKETDKQISYLRQERDALRACLLPSGIRYDGVKVQTSPSDKMSDIMAEISDYDAEIKRLQEMRVEQVKMLKRVFDQLESIDQKTALTGYYAAGKKMIVVAEEMHYSKTSVHNFIHGGIARLNELNELNKLDYLN